MLRKSLLLLVIMSALLSSAPAAVAAQESTWYWYGEYFNNRYLQGEPVFVRQDPEIDFEFGYLGPGYGIGGTDFSVRWTRQVYFYEAGTYEFGARTDDGVRLWVDGRRVISEWGPRQGEWALGQIFLNPGVHTVRMEYYQAEGWAKAHLGWRLIAGMSRWEGEYYSNRDLTGTPALTREDDRIAFEWENGSPDLTLIPADNFSVRWRRSIYFESGTYLFRAYTDDGVRVWIDNNLVIDAWFEQAHSTHNYTVHLPAGSHEIRVEYFEYLGTAAAHFWWEVLQLDVVEDFVYEGDIVDEGNGEDVDAGGWLGEYFDNPDLAGSPLFTRDDPEINFNWFDVPIVWGMPQNYFSVRWTQDIFFSRGTWRVYAEVDDGVRVWVNNQTVIYQWIITDSGFYTADVTIWRDSTVPVKVEYFEEVGEARIHVWFERIDTDP